MKIKRHQLVTLLLAAYALFMTLYFGLDILRAGDNLRFFATIAAEAFVITLTYFALKRRDRSRERNRDLSFPPKDRDTCPNKKGKPE